MLSLIQLDGTGGTSPCGDHCATFRTQVDCEETVVQEQQNAPAGGNCPSSFAICRLPVETASS